MTRQEYLNAGDGIANTVKRREVTAKAHRTYYAQFVTPGVKASVLARFDRATLTASFLQDSAFNSALTPLRVWDMMLTPVPASIASKLRELGDYPTLAGAVCIAKEAARQIVEEA